jgi:hypothetical protein
VRQITLSAIKAGITRLRDKGGASPDSLYDLLNGHVDASRSPVSRNGTSLDHTLPVGTVGLCAFQGKLHVFASDFVDPGSEAYVIDILKHPDVDYAGGLSKIHFAKPFLGFLYVVAEFENGDVFHYWLQFKGNWQASTFYKIDDTVKPSSPTGFFYKATSVDNPPAWNPSTKYAVGDVVQPTVYNGYKYTVVEADGDSPASGTAEPAWPITDGAQVTEDVDLSQAAADTTTDGATGSPAGDRYDNLPGLSGKIQPEGDS